jgi:hypothetical protein
VQRILTQYRPAVNKAWLYLSAGMLWTAVGIMLLNLAVGWLKPLDLPAAMPYVLGGLLLALAFTLLFSKLASKNVERIESLGGDKMCIFAFQAWSSYPLIIFMILLGITLRHYMVVPRPVLAIVYAGVGGGLCLSSLRYYRHLWNKHIAGNIDNA